MRGWLLWVLVVSAGAQTLPPGTRRADDHSREAAQSQQMRDAEAALERGDWAGADRLLKAAIAGDPKNVQLVFDLGYAQEREGKDTEAAASYEQAAKLDATMAEPRLALGLMKARAGDTVAAKRWLGEAGAMETASPAVRGVALRGLSVLETDSDPAAAAKDLSEAIRLTTETPEDTARAAALAARAGNAGAADQEYRRVLVVDAKNADAAAGLGGLLLKAGKLDDATAVLAPALLAHPVDPRLVATMASVDAAQGKTKDGIALLEALRTRQPEAEGPELSRLLARLYAQDEQFAKAEVLLAPLAAANPNDALLLDDLGTAQLRQMKYAEAEATFRRAVALRDTLKDDTAWGNLCGHLAFAASRNKDPQTVLQAVAERATVLPNTASMLFLEATAQDALNHRPEAVKAYRAFLAASGGKYPDEEFEARHRLVALETKR